jgi:hypothetical protein
MKKNTNKFSPSNSVKVTVNANHKKPASAYEILMAAFQSNNGANGTPKYKVTHRESLRCYNYSSGHTKVGMDSLDNLK